MAIGYGSVAVNDQLVPLPVQSAYNPWSFGPVYTGPAFWPRQGVYNVPPIITPGNIAGTSAVAQSAAYGMTSDGLGSPTMPTQVSASGNPHHLTMSPVWWAFIFLAVGLWMLTYIHYRD